MKRMSNQLELVRLLINGANEYEKETGNKNPTVYLSRNNLLVIEKALHRLESIDNANISEALEGVDILYANAVDLSKGNECIKYLPEYLKPIKDNIKQALLKAQEQEKEKLLFKNIHNTKVKTPLVSIFEGLSRDERFKFTEHIYYHWEEMKEALEAKNEELVKENTELRLKAQEPKQYLKWEDLEFKEDNEYSYFKVKLGDNVYQAFSYCSYFFKMDTVVIRANNQYIFTTQDKQFFNDLHLERVEE